MTDDRIEFPKTHKTVKILTFDLKSSAFASPNGHSSPTTSAHNLPTIAGSKPLPRALQPKTIHQGVSIGYRPIFTGLGSVSRSAEQPSSGPRPGSMISSTTFKPQARPSTARGSTVSSGSSVTHRNSIQVMECLPKTSEIILTSTSKPDMASSSSSKTIRISNKGGVDSGSIFLSLGDAFGGQRAANDEMKVSGERIEKSAVKHSRTSSDVEGASSNSRDNVSRAFISMKLSGKEKQETNSSIDSTSLDLSWSSTYGKQNISKDGVVLIQPSDAFPATIKFYLGSSGKKSQEVKTTGDVAGSYETKTASVQVSTTSKTSAQRRMSGISSRDQRTSPTELMTHTGKDALTIEANELIERIDASKSEEPANQSQSDFIKSRSQETSSELNKVNREDALIKHGEDENDDDYDDDGDDEFDDKSGLQDDNKNVEVVEEKETFSDDKHEDLRGNEADEEDNISDGRASDKNDNMDGNDVCGEDGDGHYDEDDGGGGDNDAPPLPSSFPPQTGKTNHAERSCSSVEKSNSTVPKGPVVCSNSVLNDSQDQNDSSEVIKDTNLYEKIGSDDSGCEESSTTENLFIEDATDQLERNKNSKKFDEEEMIESKKFPGLIRECDIFKRGRGRSSWRKELTDFHSNEDESTTQPTSGVASSDPKGSEVNEVKGSSGRSDTTVVQLRKSFLGVGFCVEGGKDSPHGDRPILIKKVVRGDVPLSAGDELVSVNGEMVDSMTSIQVWNLLKSLPDGIMLLELKKKEIQ